MNKVVEQELRRAWLVFDRLTAYGCAERGTPFDAVKMWEAWDFYQALLRSHGY